MLETDLIAIHSSGRGRFGALLGGASRAPYDRTLLDGGDWVLAPTLGAIVPGWLLAIPRRPVLSFRDWAAQGGKSASSVLEALTAHLSLPLDEVIWFEHGPVQPGSLIGCGLDHAHLHILIHPRFTFERFKELARETSDLDWIDGAAAQSYSTLPRTSSYMIAGCGAHAIRAVEVEGAGSQFFRRVVAKLADNSAAWNYRTSAHLANVELTIAMFGQLENASRRGA